MNGSFKWGPAIHPDVSADPYGQWASVAGRDFLVDYRNPTPGGPDRFFAVLVRKPAAELDPMDFYVHDASGGAGQDDVLYATIASQTSLQEGLPSAGAEGFLRSPIRPPFDKSQLVVPIPLREDSVGKPEQWCEPDWTAPGGLADAEQPVIIGIVDDGTAICHDRFRLPGGRSRVDFAWIQDGDNADGKCVPFGAELMRHQIEEQIAGTDDEDDLLRALGLADLRRSQQPNAFKRASHGTAVLDLATGYGPEDSALAFQRRIISVQLPGLANWDGSGAGLAYFVGWGVSYILKRARLMARRLYGDSDRAIPVIINFSFGISGGPHDGSHVLEEYISRLMRKNGGQSVSGPTEVVVAAGNGFLNRRHASTCADRGGRLTLSLPWRLGPGDRTSSFLEVWVPKTATDLRVQVAPPGGAPVLNWPMPDQTGMNQKPVELFLREDDPHSTVARLSFDDLPNHTGKKRILLAVAPTDTDDVAHPRPAAPSGLWKVDVTANVAADQEIEAWVQREELPFGYPPRGGPSYLDDPANARFTVAGDWAEEDSPGARVRRYGTMSGSATGELPLVIGAYRDGDRRAALYSAAASATMSKSPDAMAVGDTSRALPGVLAAGNRSGSVVPFSGTSAAAPQIVRLLSENIADVLRYGAEHVVHGAALRGEAVIKTEPAWSPPLPSAPGPQTVTDAGKNPPKIPIPRGGRGRVLASERLKPAIERGRYTGRD